MMQTLRVAVSDSRWGGGWRLLLLESEASKYPAGLDCC
jgi:hypothetical protein